MSLVGAPGRGVSNVVADGVCKFVSLLLVSGMATENIVEAVTLAISMPWSTRYEFEEECSPSAVVVNAIRTQITNFF
jgi:hypothetical protein